MNISTPTLLQQPTTLTKEAGYLMEMGVFGDSVDFTKSNLTLEQYNNIASAFTHNTRIPKLSEGEYVPAPKPICMGVYRLVKHYFL